MIRSGNKEIRLLQQIWPAWSDYGELAVKSISHYKKAKRVLWQSADKMSLQFFKRCAALWLGKFHATSLTPDTTYDSDTNDHLAEDYETDDDTHSDGDDDDGGCNELDDVGGNFCADDGVNYY